MNILMMSNTYLPHVGGVAKSIQAFTNEYRNRGHRVFIVAPTFKNYDINEKDTFRIPALQNFNGSDFSVALPVPGVISSKINKINPDIIHSHHPFIIGASALRIAHTYELPLVFTYHTKYEDYTHYVPGDSEILKRFVINLSTNYANLCDLVFAPSKSIASIIRDHGVKSPIVTLPTGVNTDLYLDADGAAFRKRLNIPNDAFVVGHLGRLTKEKNLDFLVQAVIDFLQNTTARAKACFLLIGVGPMKAIIEDYFKRTGLSDRIYTEGLLDAKSVVDAYAAMDVFVFSSKSETQGMVITEAMAAGTPVVAIDAPGVREVVNDSVNGRLLCSEDVKDYSKAIDGIASCSIKQKMSLSAEAKQTADRFSLKRSADKALTHFELLINSPVKQRGKEYHVWTHAMRTVRSDWERIKDLSIAAKTAVQSDSSNNR